MVSAMRSGWLVIAIIGCGGDDTTPPGEDTDGDGIADTEDVCPQLADPDQRDFDADGVGDLCDRCPHVASSNDPDGDGDGVGDACDPRPSAGGDLRVSWNGFYDPSEIATWTPISGSWEVTANRLVKSDLGAGAIELPPITGAVHAETSYEVVALRGGFRAEIGTCSGAVSTIFPAQLYCCVVVQQADNTINVEVWAQASNLPGFSISQAPWTGTFGSGSRIEMVHELSPNLRDCTVRQGMATSRTEAIETGDSINGGVQLFSQSAAARYRYLFVVSIGG